MTRPVRSPYTVGVQTLLICDVDGVLADLVGHVLETIKSDVPRDQITTYNIWDHLSIEEGEFARRLMRSPRWWTEIPPMPHAREGLLKVCDQFDAELVIASKPWEDCAFWHDARAYWLTQHFGGVKFTPALMPRKDLLNGDIFIDDHPDTLRRWKARNPGGAAICYDQPYNRGERFGRRVTWSRLGPVWSSEPKSRNGEA